MENSMMRQVDKITRAISQFAVQAPPRLDEQVRADVYEAFSSSIPASAAVAGTQHRRLLAGRRVASLAAAALIVVILLLGLRAWELLETQAYAVADTIEALRRIETVHAFCTDWQGRKFEMWIKPDPATGRNDFICLNETEQDYVAISRPWVSYYYFPGRNLVRIIRGQLITSGLDMANVIESLTDMSSKRGGSVEISRKIVAPYGHVISAHCSGATYECEAWVDPKTKLLLRLENTRRNNPGHFVKSYDEIRYNEPVPDRWLHFQCPDDAEIEQEGWDGIDDPEYGIDVTGLSDEQACRRILTRLFDAINAANLDELRRLIPLAGPFDDQALVTAFPEVMGSFWDNSAPGPAAYEIGSPSRDKACPLGLLVPCMLTNQNDEQVEITLIVRLRQADGQRTGVVVDAWGDFESPPGASYHRRPMTTSSSPFLGPINAAFHTSQSILLIVSTNEIDTTVQQRMYDYMRNIQKLYTERLPDREIKIVTDVEALRTDLSQSSVSVYGTPQGNLWLARYIAALPVVIEPNHITADRVYEGSDLRFISAWPHPQNPSLGMVIYSAQRAEDVIGINRVFHGPTDYVVARGQTVIHSANYVKKKGRWTLP
jgi:hypothetical protein